MSKVGRFPLVSRDEILVAFRPGARPTEGAFRTLRERGWVSGGLGLRPRRGNRLAGQLRVYSALNLDAVLLARHDCDVDAKHLALEASEQERRWESKLQTMIEELAATDLDSIRKLRNQLAHYLVPFSEDIKRSRRSIRLLSEFIHEEVGVLADISDDWVSLRLVSDPLETVEVQRFLAQAASVAIGDLAILHLERFGSSSLVALFPAVGEEADLTPFVTTDQADSDQPVSSFLSRTLAPVAFDSRLSSELDTRRSAGDVVLLPKRRIRLAG